MTTNLDKTNLISFRPANASDSAFILSTWLRGLRFGNNWYRLIDGTTYFQVYHALIEALLAKPGVQVTVACLKDDPEVILGYSVFEGNKLHWVQVKKAWRNIGIAKELVPKDIKTISHLTEVGKSIFLKQKAWVFNPFLLL